MAGPLPDPNARRRNAPTIPTTELPAGGREGPAPECPYKLLKRGKAWWAFAWSSPQAAAWDDGSLYTIARRAMLEDLVPVKGDVPVALLREMREIDDRLGLSPKGMAAMRWKIVVKPEEAPSKEAPQASASVRRLRAVDPAA